jgi:hypothetical protein
MLDGGVVRLLPGIPSQTTSASYQKYLGHLLKLFPVIWGLREEVSVKTALVRPMYTISQGLY